MLDKLKGYRTVIFNVIMGIIMLVRVFNPDAQLPADEAVNQALDATSAALDAVWLVGNLVLRAITDSPIFRKDT